jgi:hypothetical protein
MNKVTTDAATIGSMGARRLSLSMLLSPFGTSGKRALAGKQRLGEQRRLAEEVGFEPTVPLQVRRFSRPVP